VTRGEAVANYVLNKFFILGDTTVTAVDHEIVRRLNDDRRAAGGTDNGTAVGRLFFGLTGDEAHAGYELTGSLKVYVDDYIKDGSSICFSSSGVPIFKLQDYIAKSIATLGSPVIVVNKYIEECPMFYGVRVTVVCEDEFEVYEFQEDARNILIGNWEDIKSKHAESKLTWGQLEAEHNRIVNDLLYEVSTAFRDFDSSIFKRKKW
jgi:hypothetical protein